MTIIGLLIIAVTLTVVTLIPSDQLALSFVGGFIGGTIASAGIADWFSRR